MVEVPSPGRRGEPARSLRGLLRYRMEPRCGSPRSFHLRCAVNGLVAHVARVVQICARDDARLAQTAGDLLRLLPAGQVGTDVSPRWTGKVKAQLASDAAGSAAGTIADLLPHQGGVLGEAKTARPGRFPRDRRASASDCLGDACR